MKKFMLFIFLLNSALIVTAQNNLMHNGKWVLSKIETDAILTIQPNSGNEFSTNEVSTTSQIKIPLREYLKRELQIGVTNFIFSSDNFKFSRKIEAAFSGKWKQEGDSLFLSYLTYGERKTKKNKVLVWTSTLLEMETISKGSIVKLTFVKN